MDIYREDFSSPAWDFIARGFAAADAEADLDAETREMLDKICAPFEDIATEFAIDCGDMLAATDGLFA